MRVRRLYGAEGLPRARRRPKQRKTVTARPAAAALTTANQRCAMDVVHDTLQTGETMRVLPVVERHTRECLALVPPHRVSGAKVGAELHAVSRAREGLAPVLRLDQGTEFSSLAVDQWADWDLVTLAFGRSETPGDYGYGAVFNGNLRREFLSHYWLAPLDEVRHLLETWRTEYNYTRPHRSVANQPRAQWVTGGAYSPSRTRLSG
jgi:putative transposase